jgi:hypothetical protein
MFPSWVWLTRSAILRLLFNDLELGKAKGFFYNVEVKGSPVLYLVTNWHVASGRSTEPPYLSPSQWGRDTQSPCCGSIAQTSPEGHEGKLASIPERQELDALPPAKALLGDRGYDAGWFRNALAARGIVPCIPSKSNRKYRSPTVRNRS